MTLLQTKEGQRVRVTAIMGGANLRQKLALRGISEGVELRTISAIGPVTAKVNGGVVTLGRGMAGKIRVRKL